MKTSVKIRMFRKELKTKYPKVLAKPDDEEILAYIEAASKAFRHFPEDKQLKMAVALAADHYLTKQRLSL